MPREVGGPSMEEMGLEQTDRELESNPQFKGILEEESLKYLKANNADWFFSEYSGEVSPQGYLISKDGKETNFLPSQNISAGYPEVLEAVRARLASGQ